MAKNLKKFLLDRSPIPVEMGGGNLSKTPKDDTGYKDKFRPIHHYAQFKKNMRNLSQGSARVVFDCKVPIELFNSEDKIHFKLSGNKVNTVLKLASNDKGILQNSVELNNWMNIKGTKYERFVAPIFDWSGNPKYNNNEQYTLDLDNININVEAPDYDGVIWLQMAKCEPVVMSNGADDDDEDDDMFNNELDEFLGNPINGHVDDLIDYRSQMVNKKKHSTTEQCTNFRELGELMHLHNIGDLSPSNWGIYKGKPVILDYGFNDKLYTIYWRPQDVDFWVFIEENGHIKVKYSIKDKCPICSKPEAMCACV